jgi:hypothetical protein
MNTKIKDFVLDSRLQNDTLYNYVLMYQCVIHMCLYM